LRVSSPHQFGGGQEKISQAGLVRRQETSSRKSQEEARVADPRLQKEGEVAHDSEATYRSMFESSPEPMWVCHRESRKFLAVNEAALKLYGYRRAEFLELTLPALQAVGGSPQAVKDGKSVGRQLKKDGSFLELELIWHQLEFQGEAAYLVLLHPVGGRGREAELEHQVAELSAQLEASQRELETFSYSISHDLRAPLRHIDGFSRALLDDYGAKVDTQGAEYLSRICKAVSKMSQLIDDLQQLARVARSELSRQEVNLSVAAQVITLELKHGAPERQVEFQIAEGVSAQADPRLARQLLEILLGNAWKFSLGVGETRIEFGTVEKGGESCYFVRDNGVGFDMAYADKLFSVFHRLHRADEFEGSGVGLAIAQRIVKRHGGRIWADSAPGEGATFFFTLQGSP
jgi:PAS domain S-box-containing protein